MTGSSKNDSGLALQFVFAILSILCGLMTLYVIRVMGRWNGFLLLISNLTLCQIVYDISILLDPVQSISTADFDLVVLLRSASGVAGSIFSSEIICIVLYVIKNLQVFAIDKYFYALFCAAVIPGLAVGLVEVVDHQSMLYYWIRIALIIINIALYIVMLLLVANRDRLTSSAHSHSKSGVLGLFTIRPCKSDPVKLLALRLKYYPIVQIMCRVGVAWYEGITGTTGYDNLYPEGSPLSTKIAFYLYSITQPSAGIGYFVVFLCVSPGSYREFKKAVGRVLCLPYVAPQCYKHYFSDREVDYRTRMLDPETVGAENQHSVDTGSGSSGSRAAATEAANGTTFGRSSQSASAAKDAMSLNIRSSSNSDDFAPYADNSFFSHSSSLHASNNADLTQSLVSTSGPDYSNYDEDMLVSEINRRARQASTGL